MDAITVIVVVAGLIAAVVSYVIGRRANPFAALRSARRGYDPGGMADQISHYVAYQTGIELEEHDAKAIASYVSDARARDLEQRLADIGSSLERWRYAAAIMTLATLTTVVVAWVQHEDGIATATPDSSPSLRSTPTPPVSERPLQDYAAELGATCTNGPARRDAIGGMIMTCRLDALAVYVIRYDGPGVRASREPGKVADECTREIIAPASVWTNLDGRSGRYVKFTEACGGAKEGKLWMSYGGENGNVVLMLAGNWEKVLAATWELPTRILTSRGYSLT